MLWYPKRKWMSQHDACCEQCGAQPSTTTDDRWLAGRSPLSGSLPDDLATAVSEFYGVGQVTTLAGFVDASRAVAGGDITVEQLCHADGETPHRATAGTDTYHFECFYDGIALAHLRSEPADVRAESPSGATIEIEVSGDGTVDVTPDGAVMSFGIAPDAALDRDPTPEDVYGAVCPWVRAFPSRDAYEGWAAATDAPTVGLPLAAGTPVAAALTEAP
jgi:alkylmercury lyase